MGVLERSAKAPVEILLGSLVPCLLHTGRLVRRIGLPTIATSAASPAWSDREIARVRAHARWPWPDGAPVRGDG
jgi:hypothetical protein